MERCNICRYCYFIVVFSIGTSVPSLIRSEAW